MLAVNSIRIAAPWSRVQITWSGLRISISELASMSEALTCPGPSFFSTMRLTPSECWRSAISLMLRIMLVTSSRTPGIEENSCNTPSMCTVVMAAPCKEESSTRRSALPSVMPKPRSSGSATMVATLSRCRPEATSSLVGLIRSCQFFCNTFATGRPHTLLSMLASREHIRAQRLVVLIQGFTASLPRRLASYAPALAWAAAVMRNRGDIADRGNLEADGLQRPQRRFTPRTRPHHLDLEDLHAVLHRLFAGILRRHLGGVGRRLARPLKAHGAGRGPSNGIALRIGDGDHGIVEGRAHMRDAGADVLALAPAGFGAGRCLRLFCHCSKGSKVKGHLCAPGRCGR